MSLLLLGDRQFVERVATPTYIGWRGLHLQEGGRGAPVGMPAVLPPIETRALEMTDDIQRMSFLLARHFAPSIDGNKWRAMHGDAVAMNNGTQNGFGPEPHRDVINGRDLTAPPPRYDKMQRTFAGTFIRGEVGYSLIQAVWDGLELIRQMVLAPRSLVGKFRQSFLALSNNNVLICTPGVHGIDANKPMPSLNTIIKNNWYVIACTSGDRIWNFPQGGGDPVVYPFIFDRPISFPLYWFGRWEESYLPNHLTVYEAL